MDSVIFIVALTFWLMTATCLTGLLFICDRITGGNIVAFLNRTFH